MSHLADSTMGGMMSDQERLELLVLTTDVVAAYVSNNTISTEVLSNLITTVHGCLKSVGTAPSADVQTAAAPAVSIKKSITADAIICLDCGKPMAMLKRHLSAEHGLSADEYRAKWHLASDYPVVAPNYAAKRSALAKSIGLGQKPKTRRGRKPKAS